MWAELIWCCEEAVHNMVHILKSMCVVWYISMAVLTKWMCVSLYFSVWVTVCALIARLEMKAFHVPVCLCVSLSKRQCAGVCVCTLVCYCAPVWELSKTKNPLSHCVRLPLQAIAPIFRAPSLSLQLTLQTEYVWHLATMLCLRAILY